MAMDQSGEMPVFDRKNYLIFLDKCLVRLGDNTKGKSEVLEKGGATGRQSLGTRYGIWFPKSKTKECFPLS
jgi:hypothetical protein